MIRAFCSNREATFVVVSSLLLFSFCDSIIVVFDDAFASTEFYFGVLVLFGGMVKELGGIKMLYRRERMIPSSFVFSSLVRNVKEGEIREIRATFLISNPEFLVNHHIL